MLKDQKFWIGVVVGVVLYVVWTKYMSKKTGGMLAMGKGAAGAMALVLLWVAFASFFVAFHPGGLILASGTPARNPRDVIIWFMERITIGPSLSQQQATTGASAGAASAAGATAAGAVGLCLSWH